MIQPQFQRLSREFLHRQDLELSSSLVVRYEHWDL